MTKLEVVTKERDKLQADLKKALMHIKLLKALIEDFYTDTGMTLNELVKKAHSK
jgi:hypothetical protein